MADVDARLEPSPLTINLNPTWASSLSYDFLDHGDGLDSKPIFVGRQHLLDPLVADILHPEKSGAYLISGYRGTGKTSLLIEALWRAQQRADPKRKQFVVVLNVSEVSASLEFGGSKTAEPITIDPRRLLIALLRSLTNRVRSYDASGAELSPHLKARIAETYNKAIAATYSQESSSRREDEENRSAKSSWNVDVATPYKVGAAIAALGTLVIEAQAWGGVGKGLIHVLAGATALTAAWAFSKSRTIVQNEKASTSSAISLKFDNSLQQLENDLKDILQLLYRESLRTIVVLEELDKIDDAGGAQLDKVIRYFKNLFTQAPALFFFLADKAYFDLVASRIRKARRGRYYALEHTFFTHRLYVGRPSARDSLDFIGEAATGANYKAIVGALARNETSSFTDADWQFSRFVKTMLFRSANHLFDLKNELRRYVRTRSDGDGGVALVVDDRSFPEDEAACAVFQDLVESKIRAYAFGREKTYANEALQDHLYSVFEEMGSSRRQYVESFYPLQRQEVEVEPPGGTAPQTATVESALEWDDIQRIVDAVDSLLADLSRGGALSTFDGKEFVWKRSPARTFHLERQLEKHEVELLREVQRLSDELEFASGANALDQWIPDLGPLRYDLQQQEQSLKEAPTSLPVEAASAIKEQLQARLDRCLADVYRAYVERVQNEYGFKLEALIPWTSGEGIYRLRQSNPNPGPPAGAYVGPGEFDVLVIVGPFPDAAMPPPGPNLKRVSVIQLLRNARGARRPTDEALARLYGSISPGAAPPLKDVTVSFDVIGLDKELSARSFDPSSWGQPFGDTLVFRSYWATRWALPLTDNPKVRLSPLDDKSESDVLRTDFIDAVARWAGQEPVVRQGQAASRVLWIATPPSAKTNRVDRLAPELQQIYDSVWQTFGQARFVDTAVAERHSITGPNGLFEDINRWILWSSALQSAQKATERLLQKRNLLLLEMADVSNADSNAPREIRHALGAHGRAVYVGETLPDEFRRLGVTKIELP